MVTKLGKVSSMNVLNELNWIAYYRFRLSQRLYWAIDDVMIATRGRLAVNTLIGAIIEYLLTDWPPINGYSHT